MIPFSHPVFAVVNAVCKGQNSKRKHAKWGCNPKEKRFATSEETAYPMGLAKMFASCFVNALLSNGIAALPLWKTSKTRTSLQSLQQMRASTGMQPKASRIPALVPTFSTKVRLRGHPPPRAASFQDFFRSLQLTVWATQAILKMGVMVIWKEYSGATSAFSCPDMGHTLES